VSTPGIVAWVIAAFLAGVVICSYFSTDRRENERMAVELVKAKIWARCIVAHLSGELDVPSARRLAQQIAEIGED